MRNRHFAQFSEKERDRLRLIRLENDWSFREMAERIGMAEPTLRNILEGAHKEPLQTNVYKLRKWLEGFKQEVA